MQQDVRAMRIGAELRRVDRAGVGSADDAASTASQAVAFGAAGFARDAAHGAAADEGDLIGACAQFSALKPRLRALLGGDDFRAWIEPLVVLAADARSVTLGAPNALALARVRTDYLHRVQACWSGADAAGGRKLRLVLAKPGASAPSAAPNPVPGAATGADGARDGRDGRDDRDGLGVERPSDGASADIVAFAPAIAAPRTFETFEAGASNAAALALAMEIARGEGHGGELVLFHGLHGVGKSHLLEAIAARIEGRDGAGRSGRRAVLISAPQFLNAFQSALRDRDTSAFKAALRTADVLLVDDLQLICGKAATQEEFFQTVGDLVGLGRTVVCTADTAPETLAGLSPRMRDVLAGGWRVRIDEPDFALRAQIARTKARELALARPSFALPEAAFELIAARVTGTGRAVEGAVKQIFAASALIGREATMDVVTEAISETWRPAAERSVPVETIKRRVAGHFDLSVDDLVSQRRHRAVARPRQIAMYFCKKLTRRSYPDIGGRFGGRDHTTVMHAVKRIEELAAVDPTFSAELQQIARKITA